LTPGLGRVSGWSWSISRAHVGLRLLWGMLVVYYESMKRELKTRPTYECHCDERLKTKAEESTHLAYTGLIGELELLKIETRLIDEMFASVMGDACSNRFCRIWLLVGVS
jgi:hypothetical protein